MNLSVLQNFKPEHFKMEPFPHIHIPQVLPWSLYKDLEETYPEELMLKGKTKGFDTRRYQQKDFDYSRITALWKAFADYHTSKFFKDEAIKALQDGVKHHYGDKLYIKYARSNVGPRYSDSKDTIKMEMQFVINAIDSEFIRTPHVDQERELFAFLFYFKKFDDKIDDGGLTIYKKKTAGEWRKTIGREADLNDIEPVYNVQYRQNTMVGFLNTVNSLHGVAPRKDPTSVRRYINIDCHVREKLFNSSPLNDIIKRHKFLWLNRV